MPRLAKFDLRRLWQLAGLLLLAALLASCRVQDNLGPLVVQETQSWYPLGLHLAYLPDPQGDMTLAEVMAADEAGRFILSRSSRPTMGLAKQVVWARLDLHSDVPHASTWLLEIKPPYIDRLDVYIPQSEGTLALWQVGDQVPFDAREIPFRTFLFSIQLPAQADETVYARFEHTGQLVLDLSLSAPGFFDAHHVQEEFFQGMFYGTLLVALVYNTILLISLHARERLYTYLSLVAAASGLLYFISDGLGYWLLWPHATWFNDVARVALWPLASAAVLLMSSELMQLRTQAPRWQRLVNLGVVGWVVLALAYALTRSLWALVLIEGYSLFHLGLLIAIRMLAWLRGWQVLWNYRLIWAIYLALSLWGVLSEITGAAFYNVPMMTLSRYALLLALALTSLVVRERYNRAWQLQAEAQAAAVSAAQTAETVVREQNELLAERVDQLSDELSAFLYTTILVSQVRNWQQILQPALERMQRTLQADAICVHLLDPAKEDLVLTVQLDLPDPVRANIARIQVEPGWDTAHTSRHGISAQVWLLPLDLLAYAHRFSTLLSAHQEPLGVLTCYRQADPPFSEDQRAVAASLSEYLAVAIENQRLRQAVEAGAVIQERQRMGRDLHDSLNQSIYSLALLARAGQDALEEGDSAGLAEHLKDIESHAFLALREIRILLHALRPPELDARGLAGALEERFNMVEHRVGLQAEAWIDKNLKLPPLSEIEVYRIIIEALNNVVKHAQAQQVSVHLVQQAGPAGKAYQAVLTVTDDGEGYAPQSPGTLGVDNMRQRAAALRGDFEIHTQEQGGTLVRVTFPL